jgi:Fic family protein
MQACVSRFNRKAPLDPVLKAPITHLWFVTIHPLIGNGLFVRVLTGMLLAQSEDCLQHFYCMLAQIQAERKSYHEILETN